MYSLPCTCPLHEDDLLHYLFDLVPNRRAQSSIFRGDVYSAEDRERGDDFDEDDKEEDL